MNIKNWSGKKKVLAIFAGILAIVGLIITIFLVQKVQEIRSRAEKATVLSLAPPNQNVNPGEDAKLDVIINPGVNQVNFVKFTIKFNPDKFDPSLTVFNVSPDSPLKPLGDSSFTSYKKEGEVTFTLNVGSDATKVVRETVKLGTILLPARHDAEAGAEQISFNENETQVRSTLGTDAFNENVLSSTTPAKVTITRVCRPNVSTCEWTQIPDNNGSAITKYNFKITDKNTGDVIKEGVSSTTTVCSSNFPDFTGCQLVEFPSISGKSYTCQVSAVNDCGTGAPGEASSTCPVPSATPTPTPTGSPTPTPSASPTPKPSTTPTLTPTPKPTATPTPSPTPTNTPTPTEEVENTPTPTTPQGGVETPTPTDTPVPTLPPTGNPLVLSGIIGGILFILGGIVLLFL